MTQRIAIVAGEASGDLLAARLIKSLQALNPELVFEGIAGQEMQQAGCHSLYPLEKLSVMGLVEVLKHLPELLRIRKSVFQHWIKTPPDLFIGVDAPDFNLPLARKLKAAGIPTVHYVSPSIWAWRENRVYRIRKSIDLMLVLFPFEVEFYRRHAIPAYFVGHPLADEITFNADHRKARLALGLDTERPVLAVLPGSRAGELARLGLLFLQVARTLQQRNPALQVLVPVVDEKARTTLEQLAAGQVPELILQVRVGSARQVMQAADRILLASGTAVLEGMLSGRLMVAAYKVAPLTWWLIRTFGLLKVRYVTLPNNLAGEELVPEYLQHDASHAKLTAALEQLDELSPQRRDYLMACFHAQYRQLRLDASETAAQTLLEQFPCLQPLS
ncbi:MAG: lipid-A-disaccharide synthase [Thiothrix sp.]|nr:lipid-A-disaccharide synthase [Thiothrix sp.]HPQ94943.1 lipid-A-disaccharide synthase [Thiolinea sp.]